MKDLTQVGLFIGVILLALVIWAMVMTTPAERPHPVQPPLGYLWHHATPITDWTPHTSTVLHGD